jgi:5-deoxy-5-amino-3-dehydroquinate dehydratase
MVAGWSLRDAMADYPRPWIEVHLSNVWARESFRHESVLSPLASGVIVGLGAFGYRLAAQALLAKVPD